MAYPFADVVSGSLSVEDWFKNLCMYASNKSAKALLKGVKTVMLGNVKKLSPDAKIKLKRLMKTLESKGADKIDWDFLVCSETDP